MLSQIVDGLLAVSRLESAAVVFSVIYVVLAARQNIACWYAAFIATTLSIVLFWDVQLPMEAALNVYYLLMALYGWWQWRGAGTNTKALEITVKSTAFHWSVITAIFILTAISGYILSQHSDAKLTYVDSFTTWAAVITTWMVTKKILENWLYWIVIDVVSFGLYYQRGLMLYALLAVVYTIIAVLGYLSWRMHYLRQNAAH